MDRRWRILATIGVIGALVAPVVSDEDGYPLSTYPMYARVRESAVTFATAYALGDDGDRSSLSLGVIGDSDDPLIVAGELRAAIAADEADRSCQQIADRAADWDSLAEGATAIEVVIERRDAVTAARGDGGLIDRTVYATCEIPA